MAAVTAVKKKAAVTAKKNKAQSSTQKTLLSLLKPYLTWPNISLGLMIVSCAAIGTFENTTIGTLIGIFMFLVIMTNWNRDEFYIYSVAFLFFWDQLPLVSGTSLYRAYSYLLLLRFFIDIGKAKFRPQFLPTIMIFLIFCLFAASRLSFRKSMNMFADCTLCYLIIIRMRQNPTMMRKLMVMFSLAAICSGIYSLTTDSVLIYETGIGAQTEIIRYYGTLGDANYAACFYDIAIFMMICVDMKWYFRLPILAALFSFMFMASSITGMLCCVIGLGIYIILRYKLMGLPMMLLFGIIMFGLFNVMLYVPQVKNIAILSTLSSRLTQAMIDMEIGNTSRLTTGRSQLWSIAWTYFTKQPALNQLIGGNVVTSVLSEEYFLKSVGAVHQSYLQAALNFGIIGAVVIFVTRIFQTISDVFCYFRGTNMPLPGDLMRAVILCVFAFLFFALTIDMFMDWRFLFVYFL